MIILEDGAIIVEGNGEPIISIGDTVLTIGDGDEVTISANNGSITGVAGLDTEAEGLPEGVTVEVTGDKVTINGSEFYVTNEEANYTVTVGESFTIEGITSGATIDNVPTGTEIQTDGEGVFTFCEEAYTLSAEEGATFTFYDGTISEIKNFYRKAA